MGLASRIPQKLNKRYRTEASIHKAEVARGHLALHVRMWMVATPRMTAPTHRESCAFVGAGDAPFLLF
jgi:hypothetical protein